RLRLFYLDRNWLGTAVDGALSIGVDNSRTALVQDVVRDTLIGAAWRAAWVRRPTRLRRPVDPEAAPHADAPARVTGMLLRSALVTGWPALEVRAFDANGGQLRTLRIAHLSPSVLLCLFYGVPSSVQIAQPTEGLRFGTDDAGRFDLRNPVAPT